MNKKIMTLNKKEALQKMGGREDFYESLVQKLLDQTPKNIDLIKESIKNQLWSQVKHMAHQLKGNFSIIGAEILTDLFTQLFLSAQSQNQEKSLQISNHINKALDELYLEIEKK